MKRYLSIVAILLFSLLSACQQANERALINENQDSLAHIQSDLPIEEKSIAVDTIKEAAEESSLLTMAELAFMEDTAFVDVLKLDSNFVLDMKYATTNNFTKQVLYDCERCLLRKEVAIALVNAHQIFQDSGFILRLFDCYRPNTVQWKMWGVYPDKRYVADPAKGSEHNRGGAVDLTIQYADGRPIDMGSPFDFFGVESHFAYTNLPDTTLAHRKYLRKTLESVGFGGITSEWWHFSYRNKRYAIGVDPLCEIEE